MKMRALTLSALLFAFCVPAMAAEALVKSGVVLLQPDFVLQERVPNVRALASYIQEVQKAAQTALVASQQRVPSGGFIVLAVRPGDQSKIWLDFTPRLPPEVGNALISKIGAVTPVAARGGPVVFAIKVSIWGGQEPDRNTPSVAEWTAAAKKAGHPLEVGELVERVWSD